MVKLGSSCKNCCFYDEDLKDCLHGLLDVFKERGAEIEYVEEVPLMDRICQYKRPNDWHAEKTIDERVEICGNEIYISGTIVLIADNKANLERAIKILNANSNIKNFKFIVIYKHIQYKDILDVCGNNIGSDYKYVLTNTDDINFQIYQSLKHAKNGFLFIIDCSKEFDHLVLDKVNNMLNKKLFRILHIPGTDGVHQSVSMIHIYKWLKGDLQCSFSEKLKDISNQENSDAQILNWEQVNEQYSS